MLRFIKKWNSISGITIVIIPVAIFYYVVSKYNVNIPYADEYGTALYWLIRYISIDSELEKIKMLFDQANEHRIFICNLATITDYKVFGNLNFIRLVMYANIGMIPLVSLIIYQFKNKKTNPWTIIPVILLMFIPQVEIHNWSIVALVVVYQYIFIFTALILLSRQSWIAFAGAAILSFITTFTFGNGMFIFISGFLILIILHRNNFIRIYLWSITMIISIWLYFTDFNFSSGFGFKLNFLEQIIPTLQYFLILFGSIFHVFFPGNLVLLTISGGFVLSSFGLILYMKWHEIMKQPVTLSIMLFIVLSAGAVSVSRVSMGLMSATSPRYVMYQAIFLSLLYIILIDSIKHNRSKIIALFLILSTIIYGYRLDSNIKNIKFHQDAIKDQIYYYYTNFRKIKSSNPEIIKSTLDRSKKFGIYTPPALIDLFPEISKLNLVLPTSYSDKLFIFVDKLEQDSSTIELSGWSFTDDFTLKNQKTAIVLQSASNFITFSVSEVIRKDVKRHFVTTYPDLPLNTGFHIRIDKNFNKIPTGNYNLGICVSRNDTITYLKLTDKYVQFN